MNIDAKTLAWGALYLVLLVVAAIFTGGISDQAQFGPSHVCLLFVGNYHEEGGVRLFDADSPACGVAVGVGILGILLSIILGGTLLYFLAKDQARAKRVILAFAVVATMYTLVALVASSLVTAGLKKSCEEFEKAQGDAGCGIVFSYGFFTPGVGQETKNLGTVKAAASAGWILVLGWLGYAGAEWWNWRVASQRWW
ncbi:hypothetical protein SpCBS45565_g02916 [Spizellomyces sp. 'palustris']|nr:hypothetical protein SpCBS45565_g02916 [Spizellomyces sp. 'palustris']